MNVNVDRGIGYNELSKAWLSDIDNTVDRYLSKDLSKDKLVSEISKLLNKLMHGYTFDINIIEGRTPFMMCIYPELNQLETRCHRLSTILNDIKSVPIDFVKEWNRITKWCIEVDMNLLNPKSKYCVADGREFTSILLHEIGHVSVTNQFKMINTYRKNRAKFQMVEKLLLSESFMMKKIFLPMYLHTLNFRVITSSLSNDLEEIKADLSIPLEYKGDLVAYLDRCVLRDPVTMNTLVCSDSEFEEDQKIAALFTIETLEFMKDRRYILNKYIEAQHKLTESPYLKEFTKRFAKLFTGYRFDSKSNSLDIVAEGMLANQFMMECSKYEDRAMKILTESQRVSDRDLSILQVDGDSIETNEDKIYVLHTIYDYMELIATELRKKNKEITINEINKDTRMIYLISLKNKVLEKKIIDKEYGVFIKYPKGYEG